MDKLGFGALDPLINLDRIKVYVHFWCFGAEPPPKAVTAFASNEGSTWVVTIEKHEAAIFKKTSKKPALKP